MITEARPLAVIPARGGSRRIPGKNLRLFHGKPIIHYAIEAAVKSGLFCEVMVSTDDGAIADAARSAGSTVPFLRSNKNSDDRATLNDALAEVLEAYEKQGRKFQSFACIMATAAFVTPDQLRDAFTLMRERNADSVVAVTRFGFPIQKALRLTDGRLTMFAREHDRVLTQEFEPAFHDCGQFFFCKTPEFLVERRVMNDKTYAYEIPESHAQDIDNEEDWRMAELKYDLVRRGAKT